MSYALGMVAGAIIGIITPPCWKRGGWRFALGIVAIFLAMVSGKL
jgi:hypothetical protein